MIHHVRGRLVERRPGLAVVDVGGVGFALAVSDATLSTLPAPGTDVRLLTVLHVREDALQLFAFAREEERALFARLLTVTGVGPKLALAILSAMPVASFLRAVAQGTPRPLTSVPGVGKRLAERLVVELRDRVAAELEQDGGPAEAPGLDAGPRDEAVTALVALGLPKATAADLVSAAGRGSPNGDASAEDLIRRSLAALAGRP